MFEQIQSPQIFTYDSLMAQMSELFQGLDSNLFSSPVAQELFESLSDEDFLADYLVNTLDEDYDFVMTAFKGVYADEQITNKIVNYYDLFKQLHALEKSNEAILIHPSSLEDYLRPLFAGSESVQQLSSHINWSSYTEEHAQNCEYISLDYPLIGFSGSWIIK